LAQALLEGTVFKKLKALTPKLVTKPIVVTRAFTQKKARCPFL
jgi:hypothetical protein